MIPNGTHRQERTGHNICLNCDHENAFCYLIHEEIMQLNCQLVGCFAVSISEVNESGK